MNEQQYRKRWIRRHKKYERQTYKILMRYFRDSANKIPFNFLTESNYNMIVEGAITQDDLNNSYYEIYRETGIQEGKWVGNFINKQLKDFTFDLFLSEFEKNLFSWLLQNSSYRIVTVRQDFIKYIQAYLAQGVLDGKTMDELSKELQLLINRRNFYRWQALRIARTETTAAANYAATVAHDTSGVISDKVWISAIDARTRRPPRSDFNHVAMNGVKVPYNEPFNVSGESLMFPGDPKGSAGNVINCRCTVAVVARRDQNGRLIRTDRINTI